MEVVLKGLLKTHVSGAILKQNTAIFAIAGCKYFNGFSLIECFNLIDLANYLCVIFIFRNMGLVLI